MIVSEAELRLIEHARRRCMLLPVLRGSQNQRRACPVETGQCVKLQPRPFAKSLAVTVIEPPTLTTFALALTETNARQQGYASIRGAADAWTRSYGAPTPDTEVWVIRFARGDHSHLWSDRAERYLRSKMGGARPYTTDPDKAASGEGAVPYDDEMRFAAAAALRRSEETAAALDRVMRNVQRELHSLRPHEADLDRDTKERIRWLSRRAEQLKQRRQTAA